MRFVRLFSPAVFTLIFLCAFQSAVAQAKLDNCTEIKATDDFLALADRRGDLMAESQDLRDEIGQLENYSDVLTVPELEKLKSDLDGLLKKADRNALEEQTVQTLQNRLKVVKTDESIKHDIDDKKSLLAKDKELLICVQEAISQLTSPDKNFRFSMSMFFAGLIAMVILGFFVLAGIDQAMRRAIFSGETGIQFLTLFSIVIAIILFGITSILESRELSALLGGLSGYILGRTARQGAGQSQTASQPDMTAFADFVKKLASIAVSPPAATLSAGNKTVQLAASPKDASGTQLSDPNKFFVPMWESTDTKVAKVDDTGLVSMVATGNCSITASFANVTSNECQVTVQ